MVRRMQYENRLNGTVWIAEFLVECLIGVRSGRSRVGVTRVGTNESAEAIGTRRSGGSSSSRSSRSSDGVTEKGRERFIQGVRVRVVPGS